MSKVTITIHRGANQIGGCITEIATDGAKIFIDFGSNLPGSKKKEYTQSQIADMTSGADAIFYTQLISLINIILSYDGTALVGSCQFLDDGSVYLVAFYSVISGALKFIIDLVSGGNTEEIGHVHVLPVSESNCKGFARLNIEPCSLALTDEKNDLIIVADLSPRYVHNIYFFILIIGGNHQHRHRVNCLHQT